MGKSETTFLHSSLTISVATEGGYMVRASRGDGYERSDVAAFSTLEEAAGWLKKHMVSRSASVK